MMPKRQLEQRRVELPTTEEIKEYVADFRDFLEEGTIPRVQGAHPQLRGGHRGQRRRGRSDVHHSHAERWCDLGIGLGS